MRHAWRIYGLRAGFLVCHGGNAPIAQVLSRELRSELGIAPFILSAGAFGHPDVKATISKGNIWDFHGGEMETSMVMAVDESLVKLELSEAGEPTAFEKTAPEPYGPVSIGWVSEDWKQRRIADWNWGRSVWCKRREGANYIRDECAGTGPGAVRYPGLE